MSDTTSTRVAWVGLGRIGTAMADRLIDAGHHLTVYNRTAAKIAEWRQTGVAAVDTPAACASADIVFVTVSGSADLIEVVTGPNGVLAHQPEHAGIIVDCSTVSPEASAEVRVAARRAGWQFLAAPISGNPNVVRAGKSCIVASGPLEAYEAVAPLLDTIGSGVYAGDGEVARLVKLGHNLLLGMLMQSVSEVVSMLDKAGVEREAFFDFIGRTVLGSPIIVAKSQPVITRQYTPPTFTTTLLRKDFDLGLAQARALEVPMPVASMVHQLIQSAIGLGYGEDDFAALYEPQAAAAGLPRPR